MKKHQLQEIKNKSVEELKKDLNQLEEKLAILQLNLAAGKVKNIQEIKATKKSIAQILTLINQKIKTRKK